MSEIPKVINKNRRILIFSLAYFPNVGGAEIAIKEITDRIPGFEFDLIAFNLNKNSLLFEKIGNINVYRVGGLKSLYPVLAFWKACVLHRKHNYSLIWSMMAAHAGFAGMFFKSVFMKIPFLLTLQEGDPEEHILERVGILYPLWRNIFKEADYIQAISTYLAEFGKKYGATCPIEVVPNGVDINKFQTFEVSPETIRRELGLKTDDKVLIHTGRIVTKNALGDIVRSLSFLPSDVKFLNVGGGGDKKQLVDIAKSVGVESRLFLVDYVNHSKMINYLHASDVYVRPSLSEGLGNVFLEAMMAGLPVIGTNVGGIPDFLVDGETGLFCEVNNPKSIAEKVKLLLSDEELRGKLIINGRKMVKERYDWDAIAKRIEYIFDLTIAKRS